MLTPGRVVEARRVNSMALFMEPEDIAARLGITSAEVVAMIRRDSRVSYWVARCNRTGRTLLSPTERGAYLRAQIVGFSDWDLYGVPASEFA